MNYIKQLQGQFTSNLEKEVLEQRTETFIKNFPLSFVFGLSFTFFLWSIEFYKGAWATLAYSGVNLVFPVVLYFKKMRYNSAIYLMTVVTYSLYLYFLFYTGGPDSPYKIWLVTMISSSLWYFDRKNAIVNAVIVFFIYVASNQLENHNLLTFPNLIPKEYQTLHSSFVFVTFILFYLSFIFMYEDLLQRSTDTIKEQNEEISTQNEQLNIQQEEMLAQNENLEKTQDIVESSLKYARKIQRSMLPKEAFLAERFTDSFVINKPKQIVGGDFFWYAQKDDQKILVISDCTGQGVPAALLTMLSYNMLNQIVHRESILQPSLILETLEQRLQEKLNTHINNGISMSILSINEKEKTFVFCGANQNGLRIDQNGELDRLLGNKMPLGGQRIKPFQDYSSTYQKGDTFYLFSDGYYKQLGEDDNARLLRARFRDLMSEISLYEMKIQKVLLKDQIEKWKHDSAQTDDILIVGIKQ